MKNKLLLTLLVAPLLLTGCNPTTNTSSNTSQNESIQEIHVDSIDITNKDITMKPDFWR